MRQVFQLLLVGLFVLGCGVLLADGIELKKGDRITGKIIKETDDSVVIKTAYGNMTIPRSEIKRIERTPAAPKAVKDTVVLKNGDKLTGKIVGQTDKSVTIKTTYGELTIPRSEIKQIERAPAAPKEVKAAIRLKNGDKVKGKIIERTDKSVTIETAYGRMTIPRSEIEEISEAGGPGDEYKKKLASLAEKHYKLAQWCREKGLEKEARKHLERAVKLNPDIEKAREEPGREKKGGRPAPKTELEPPARPAGKGSPFLGVSLVEGIEGVLIEQVVEGHAGEKAGLRVGDEILKINGKEVATPQDLVGEIQNCSPGDEITLTIKRGDQEKEVKAVLGERPEGMTSAPGPGDVDIAKIQQRIQELMAEGKSWEEVQKIVEKEFGVRIQQGGIPPGK